MNKIYKESGEIQSYTLPKYTVTKWGQYKDYNPEFMILDSSDNNLLFKVNFLDGVDLFYNDKISFSIKILARDVKYFYKEIYTLNDIRKDQLNLSTFDLFIDKNKLKSDNEYIFKLTYNLINDDNTIYSIVENTSEYIDGMASLDNNYLVVLKNVDTPEINIGSLTNSNISGLKTKTIITDKKIRSLTLDYEYKGSIIVTIDGMTMSENYDYERKDKIIIFNDFLPKDTVVTITGFSDNDSRNGFVAETNLVYSNNKTPSHTNIKEGVFYNKDTNKFGISIKSSVSNTSEPFLVLNGQQLLINTDFYVDPNDATIIYLNGLLLEDDIVTFYYVPEFVTNEIYNNKLLMNIMLENPILNESGFLELQISNTKEFSDYENVKINYIDGQGVYIFDFEYHKKGLKFIRVINKKTYQLINSKEIMMSKESKILKIFFK